MFRVPLAFRPLLVDLLSCYPRPSTAHRMLLLMAGAILTSGNRTVSNILRLLALLDKLNPSTYHRVLSHRRWHSRALCRTLARFVLDRFVPQGVVLLCGDDTVDGHRGKHVYGKARHRDAVRSSHSHTAFRYGHRWVVLSVLVKLPYAHRPLALPLLIALYRDAACDAAEGRRHKTPSELMCGLLSLLMRWFPEKRITFVGDSGFGTHRAAVFAKRHRGHLTLVSKLPPKAALFAPPPPRRAGTKGRPPLRGDALAKPIQAVVEHKGRRLKVRWYGGSQRVVRAVGGTGGWYRGGAGLVPLRWVYVRDESGTHRDECFYSTDASMPLRQIIETYCARWNIETTFQEMREHLGLESTRGWSRETVLRMAPCLMYLYTLVVVFYDTLPRSGDYLRSYRWKGKRGVTFSDMISSVRRYLWLQWIFDSVPGGEVVKKLPPPVRKVLDFGLAHAT